MQEDTGQDLTSLSVDTKAASAYLASLKSTVGRHAVKSVLNKIACLLGSPHYDQINWASLNAASAQALLSKIADTPTVNGNLPSPATVALALSVIKGVARASWQRDQISTDNYQRIKDLKPPRGSRLLKGRDIDVAERAALIQTCSHDNTPAGIRDTTIMAVLITTGMRRSELVSLKLPDINLQSGKTIIRGKGDKERTAYIKNAALRALTDWLSVRGTANGAVFCVINKGKTIFPARHMSTTALHLILKKRANASGISNITAHDFRRTFAGELLDNGADIVTVANLLGHSSPSTTAKYDRRGERRKEQASSLITVSYAGRLTFPAPAVAQNADTPPTVARNDLYTQTPADGSKA